MNSAKQLANLRVSSIPLNSSGPIHALAVVQMDSTGGIVSGGAGGGSTQVSVRDILTSSGASVMDGVNNAINVNVVAGAAAGSTYVSVRQSTAADLNASIVQGSTVWQTQVSSVGGVVTVSTGPSLSRVTDRDQSTQVAAVLGTAPASTTYGLVTRDLSTGPFQISSVGGVVTVSTGPVAVSSIAGVSRIAANNAADGIVHVGDSTNAAIRVNVVAGAAGGSTDVSITQLRDSSGGSVSAGDSANQALRVNVVAGAAGGSTIVTVSTGSLNVAGILDSSNALVKPGDSANNAVRVNIIAGAGSGGTALADQAAFSSAVTSLTPVGGMVGAGDVASGKAGVFRMSSNRALYTFPVDSSGGVITDSTQRAFRVTSVDAASTGPIAISSIAGVSVVRPETGSTWSVRPLQSSAADLQVTARINTSSGGAVEGSTTTLSTGSVLGLNVREVMPSGRQSTTVVITSTASTALYTLVSSVANLKHCVTAYFVGSTHTLPSTLVFWSSNAIDRWAVNFGSGSSGITGANLATVAPDWLFQTDVSNALRVSIEGGSSGASTVIARVSIKWFTEA